MEALQELFGRKSTPAYASQQARQAPPPSGSFPTTTNRSTPYSFGSGPGSGPYSTGSGSGSTGGSAKTRTSGPSVTHYEVLGVSRTATAREITVAYRKLALKYHPDKNLKNAGVDTNAQYLEIKEAYEILKDPITRRTYDAGL